MNANIPGLFFFASALKLSYKNVYLATSIPVYWKSWYNYFDSVGLFNNVNSLFNKE